ncbi:MAG: MOSC domain-containing protein [Halonotius sp.]
MPAPASATVECISIYPIKSLDGRSVQRVEIVTNGGLAGDREYALFDSDGNYVNGKNDRQVHPIRASYDGDGARAESVTLSTPEQDATRFDLGAVDGDEAAALTDWLREWFGYPVTLDRNREGGFPDDTTASGPTIISEATIETVAGWFDDVDPEGMRRRLRPNIVLGGVPAFWEDHLFADRNSRVRFAIGDAEFLGVNPCQRCVVPSRDPDTGDEIEDFNKTFIEQRRATMPDWSGGDWFDHEFRLMVNTAVPEASWGETIAVGDELTVGETVSAADMPVPAE